MAADNIIRSVTESLLTILRSDVTILPADKIIAQTPDASAGVTQQMIFVYLFQVLESASLRNTGPRAVLGSGGQIVTQQKDPLALDLHYLLIPLSGPDNYADSHNLLGAAMRSFNDHSIFCPGALGVPHVSAEDAKLEFRLTLNPLPTSELIRLWEAVQQPYRLSVAYVVRTVLIDSLLSTDTRLVSERRFVREEM